MKQFFKITFDDLQLAKSFFNNENHYSNFLYVISEYYQGNSVVARYKIVSRYVATYKQVMDRIIEAKKLGSKGGKKRVENQQVIKETLEGSVKGGSSNPSTQLLTTNNKLLTTNNEVLRKKEIDIVIDYFNSVCGTDFKKNTKATIEKVQARFNEKFTIEDFKSVIDFKNKQWKDDPKMKEYLRPETLFGSKFEAYLQASKTDIQAKKEYNPSRPQDTRKVFN